jgi:hypothetical protein
VNKKQKIPPAAQIAIAVVAVLLVALVGWFGLVHPKSGAAANLSTQIDAANARLLQAQSTFAAAKRQKPVRVANLFRLVKAMPDAVDMSGILLQLSQVAKETGINFESITPGNPVPLTGYSVVPIKVVFGGSFYDLSDFLLRLRTLVAVRHGALDATGRLFAVDTLGFGPARGGFPQIDATLSVDAFIYAAAAPAGPAIPTIPATSGATSTGTTPSSAASALGAKP